jgi:hypothetical protein
MADERQLTVASGSRGNTTGRGDFYSDAAVFLRARSISGCKLHVDGIVSFVTEIFDEQSSLAVSEHIGLPWNQLRTVGRSHRLLSFRRTKAPSPEKICSTVAKQ